MFDVMDTRATDGRVRRLKASPMGFIDSVDDSRRGTSRTCNWLRPPDSRTA